MRSPARRFLAWQPVFVSLYITGLIIAVPLSLIIWFVRRNFNEQSVAGEEIKLIAGRPAISNDVSVKFRLSYEMLVVIIHPEQWNGGSDRSNLALIKHFARGNNRVVWYTTMIDEYWANEDFAGVEIREVPLRLHPGDWFSQNIALGYSLVFSDLQPDLVVVDHSASCLPMIKWRFPQCKILFYCHFPQQLVTPSRFFLYRWYSNLIALVEAKMFESADAILVNSKFTAKNFIQVMPSVPGNKVQVVYPPCDVDSVACGMNKAISRKARSQNARFVFLSMNRFWPEKRLDIIVEAAAILRDRGLTPRIQLAGSVMPHIPESRIYYAQLLQMVDDLSLHGIIEFVKSPSEEDKFRLYRECDTALYTPPNEHFGIVPIEALEQRRPVIVIDSGGPSETVLEGITGTKIAEPCGKLLAEAMIKHMANDVWDSLDNDDLYEKQRERFRRDFSAEGFGGRVDDAVLQMYPNRYVPVSPLCANFGANSNLPAAPVKSSTVPTCPSTPSRIPKVVRQMSERSRYSQA